MIRTRLALALLFATLPCCAPAVSVLRTSAPLPPPTHPDRVRIFMDEQSAPDHFQELGLIIANTHVFVPVMVNLDAHIALAVQRLRSGDQGRTEVFRALIRQAACLGADAIIIKGFDKAGVHLSITGVAIRLGPGAPPL